MRNKDLKRRMAYEGLVILGTLALLLFICRLWPFLLLVILGIFVAAIRLVFLSTKKVENVELMPPPALPQEPTGKDVQELAYSSIQRRITELVLTDHPSARWVWETSNAKRAIMSGDEVFILLNRAGGYRKALVIIQNLQVCGLAYQEQPNDDVAPKMDQDEEGIEEPIPQNYEYLAFEWVDAHAVDLNERCNECIAQGVSTLFLKAEELPLQESWPDICRELERGGMETCTCLPDGIEIHLAL